MKLNELKVLKLFSSKIFDGDAWKELDFETEDDASDFLNAMLDLHEELSSDEPFPTLIIKKNWNGKYILREDDSCVPFTEKEMHFLEHLARCPYSFKEPEFITETKFRKRTGVDDFINAFISLSQKIKGWGKIIPDFSRAVIIPDPQERGSWIIRFKIT